MSIIAENSESIRWMPFECVYLGFIEMVFNVQSISDKAQGIEISLCIG